MQLETQYTSSFPARMVRHKQCKRRTGKHRKVKPQTHTSRQAWKDGSASLLNPAKAAYKNISILTYLEL